MSMHVGQTGILRFTVKDETTLQVKDVSDALTIEYVLRAPSGTETTVQASLENDGTDGITRYAFDTSFLDEVGRWRYQVIVTKATEKWFSDINTFDVEANL